MSFNAESRVDMAICGDNLGGKRRYNRGYTMLEVKPTKMNGRDAFLIDYGMVHGERMRHYFQDKQDAVKELDHYNRNVKKAGEWWARQPEADRLMIQSTLQKMADAGTNLQTVWVEHQKWKADRELPGSSAITPMAYEDVVAEWGQRKRNAGKDARYVLHATADLMKFGSGQEKRPIHEIPHEQLEKWIGAQRIQKKGTDFGKPWGLSTKRTWIQCFAGRSFASMHESIRTKCRNWPF